MSCWKRQRRSSITWSGQYGEREHEGNYNTFINSEQIPLDEWFILQFLFVNCPGPTVISHFSSLPFPPPRNSCPNTWESNSQPSSCTPAVCARMSCVTWRNQPLLRAVAGFCVPLGRGWLLRWVVLGLQRATFTSWKEQLAVNSLFWIRSFYAPQNQV